MCPHKTLFLKVEEMKLRETECLASHIEKESIRFKERKCHELKLHHFYNSIKTKKAHCPL